MLVRYSEPAALINRGVWICPAFNAGDTCRECGPSGLSNPYSLTKASCHRLRLYARYHVIGSLSSLPDVIAARNRRECEIPKTAIRAPALNPVMATRVESIRPLPMRESSMASMLACGDHQESAISSKGL